MDPPWIDGPAHWGDPEYEKAMRTMDKATLQAAVELAPGFELGKGPSEGMFYHYWSDSQHDFIGTEIDDPEQYLLDALAAELVRMVDALPTSTAAIKTYKGSSTIFRRKIEGKKVYKSEDFETLLSQSGLDRTENTITAIVEFAKTGALTDSPTKEETP